VLYGLVLLFQNLRRQGLRGLRDGRVAAFILIPPLTLLATPYGTSMAHYYRVTLMNPQFSRMVTEWKPVMSVPVLAVPLFLLLAVTFAAVLRVAIRARSTTAAWPPLFDVLTLTALGIGAVMAVRNVTWFGLAFVVLFPAILTQAKGGAPAPLRLSRTNRTLAVAMLGVAVLATVVILARPAGWFTSTYPTRAIATLRALVARYPQAKVLADVRYADWLIWEDPQLFGGRVAYDTSFELLNTAQLSAIADLAAGTRNARHMLDEFRCHWRSRSVTRRSPSSASSSPTSGPSRRTSAPPRSSPRRRCARPSRTSATASVAYSNCATAWVASIRGHSTRSAARST